MTTKELIKSTTSVDEKNDQDKARVKNILAEIGFSNINTNETNGVGEYLATELMYTFGWEDNKILSVLQIVGSVNSQDAIEAMLASQMVAVHDAIMDSHRFSKKTPSVKNKDQAINSMTKLARTYTSQMEALNRHRGKGQQKITVEHLNVNDGGKAVVGSVGK
jgi:hypothetical protein